MFIYGMPAYDIPGIYYIVCLRKYVSRNLLLKKMSRRQYLRQNFEKKAKMYFIEGRF